MIPTPQPEMCARTHACARIRAHTHASARRNNDSGARCFSEKRYPSPPPSIVALSPNPPLKKKKKKRNSRLVNNARRMPRAFLWINKTRESAASAIYASSVGVRDEMIKRRCQLIAEDDGIGSASDPAANSRESIRVQDVEAKVWL